MKIGTKSLLFGVHHFLWHPFTVWMAWKKLYGRPDWKEFICIFIHDFGYLGCSGMDNHEGKRHPELGAQIAGALFGKKYRDLCLYHSRTYAKIDGQEPSKLCYADKLSIIFEPTWFYLLRASLTKELVQYRQMSDELKMCSLDEDDKVWFATLKEHFIDAANIVTKL